MSGDRVVVYPDAAGEWRWRREAGNNRTVASSGEAFDSRSNAVRAAHRSNQDVGTFSVDDDTMHDTVAGEVAADVESGWLDPADPDTTP